MAALSFYGGTAAISHPSFTPSARNPYLHKMATTAKLIGGAGTGKTTELMRILGDVISTGVSPYEIGFCSFTRAARQEAAERVEAEFGIEAKQLQAIGWFRTLHSICYQSIGGGRKYKLLADNKESRAWIEEAVGEKVDGSVAVNDQDLPDASADGEQSQAAIALSLWSLARNRLVSLDEVHAEQALLGGGMFVDLEHCRELVEKYERQKYLDDRMDFADVVGRAVGWRWDPAAEPMPTMSSEGELPDLPVWIFDEHQDSSRLLSSVSRALVDQPGCRWAYFAGDPFQSIYGFSGADHRCLLDQETDKTRIMQRSYRCPAGVLELSERVLRRCSDYFDREIMPNSDEHGVDATHQFRALLGEIDPAKESWLFIARTNLLAKRFYKALESEAIPWDYTRGSGGYCTPTVRSLCDSFGTLQNGLSLTREKFVEALKALPCRHQGQALLSRGVKTAAAAGKHPLPEETVSLDRVTDFGWTEQLQSMVRSGSWTSLVTDSHRFTDAKRRFGSEAAMNPNVRVGTIHSVKGSEADNVVMLDSLTRRVEMGRQSPDGFDAEQRVSYVGVTRARKRLIVLSQRKDRYRMELA